MMNELAPVLVTLIVFYFVAYIVRISYDTKIRSKLIDKGLTEEQTQKINFNGFSPQGPASLKWGLVSTALGAGLFLRILANRMIDIELRDEFTLGLMLFLAGLSLIVYYFIAKKLSSEEDEK
jgi:hypothetical protein